jgi:hypothetical protein
MTPAVRELLAAFDALSEAEKQEAAAEVLRRVSALEAGPSPRPPWSRRPMSCSPPWTRKKPAVPRTPGDRASKESLE